MTTETQSFLGRTISASLTVKDLQKSLVWYQDVVGFTVDRRHEREGKLVAVSLKAGDVRLLIGQDDGAKGWDRVKGDGFSLHITTDQNIDELANRIKAHGGNLLSEPADMPWGPRVFRIQDPDGFKIAISSVPHSDVPRSPASRS
jgi:lactoylglutathione lyase